MSKALAYGCLAVIALGLLGVDYLVLTSTWALSRIARTHLDKALGDAVQYSSLSASIAGGLTLRSVSLHATPKRVRVLSADRVHVALARRAGEYVPESITLYSPRVTLSHEFIEELVSQPSGRPLRELYPPDALPRIRCQGGQVEFTGRSILDWRAPQVFLIEDLALVPVSGYRYFAGGRLRSQVLGTWRLSGEFDLDSGASHISISSESVTFGSEVRAALAPDIQASWDDYAPQGLARVRILVDSVPGQPTSFRVTVAPVDMKIRYSGFSYPIEKVHGEIDFFADRFVVKHLEGGHGDTRLRFDGRANGYAAEADFDFRIEIDAMPLDDMLRAALEPSARAVYDQFRPSGLVDVRGRVTREYGLNKVVRNPLDIRVRGGSCRYLPFPYELTDVQGELHLDIPTARIKLLTGVRGGASFEISGRLDDLDNDPVVDLRIRSKNVPLDASLKHALPPDQIKTWERFAPSGFADIEWQVTKAKGGTDIHRGTAVVRAGRVTFRDVPVPVTDVTGHIVYGPDAVMLNHMEGRVDAGTIRLNGTVLTPPGGLEHSYEITAIGARVDERFKKAMPKRVADILEVLRLSGLVNFQLHFAMKGEGAAEEMHWRIRVDLRRAAIEAKVRFEDIEGAMDFVGSIRGGRMTGSGTLTFQTARVMKKKITDVTASFLVEDDNVSFARIRATAYGGSVEGYLRINSETTELSGEFKVDRLELREFVRDTDDYANRALSGKVNVEIRALAGRGNDPATLTGQGSLTITDGQLFEVPGVARILSPFSGTRRFKAGTVLFDIEQRKFRMSHFGFESDAGSVYGKGDLTFDGDYDVRVRVDPAPILGIDFFIFKIPGAIFGQLMRTRIQGNLNSAEGVTEEVKPGDK